MWIELYTRYRVEVTSRGGYTRGFCRGVITRDTMEYIGCKPINPPLYSDSSSRFWIFGETALPLLRTGTAAPPTVANTF